MFLVVDVGYRPFEASLLASPYVPGPGVLELTLIADSAGILAKRLNDLLFLPSVEPSL